MKEDKGLEEICRGIAKALFSSPLQKLVVTGGMAPILVVSKDNVSYTEVAIFRASEEQCIVYNWIKYNCM